MFTINCVICCVFHLFFSVVEFNEYLAMDNFLLFGDVTSEAINPPITFQWAESLCYVHILILFLYSIVHRKREEPQPFNTLLNIQISLRMTTPDVGAA